MGTVTLRHNDGSVVTISDVVSCELTPCGGWVKVLIAAVSPGLTRGSPEKLKYIRVDRAPISRVETIEFVRSDY